MLQNVPKIEISVRYDKKVPFEEMVSISKSEDLANFCRKLFNADTIAWTEEMILVCLNHSNKVIGYYKVSQGGIAGTVCDPKVIYTVALNCCASSIVISHNHPSGNLKPSNADIELTRKIKEAGRVLDIRLLDHVIVSDEGFYSFADDGQL